MPSFAFPAKMDDLKNDVNKVIQNATDKKKISAEQVWQLAMLMFNRDKNQQLPEQVTAHFLPYIPFFEILKIPFQLRLDILNYKDDIMKFLKDKDSEKTFEEFFEAVFSLLSDNGIVSNEQLNGAKKFQSPQNMFAPDWQ
jgi:hypothetical protein